MTTGTPEAMLSSRVAADVLAALLGMGLRQARQVLDSGLAGAPLVERGSHLYAESAIAGLAARPVLDPEAPHPDWSALLVLRRPVPAAWSWRDRADALSTGWDIPATALVPLGRAETAGPVLVLGCTAGFVTTVARLLDARTPLRGRHGTCLVLGDPPAPLHRLSTRRVPGTPGRSWSWHEPRPGLHGAA